MIGISNKRQKIRENLEEARKYYKNAQAVIGELQNETIQEKIKNSIVDEQKEYSFSRNPPQSNKNLGLDFGASSSLAALIKQQEPNLLRNNKIMASMSDQRGSELLPFTRQWTLERGASAELYPKTGPSSPGLKNKPRNSTAEQHQIVTQGNEKTQITDVDRSPAQKVNNKDEPSINDMHVNNGAVEGKDLFGPSGGISQHSKSE